MEDLSSVSSLPNTRYKCTCFFSSTICRACPIGGLPASVHISKVSRCGISSETTGQIFFKFVPDVPLVDSYALPNLVMVPWQIHVWPPSAILDFSCYRSPPQPVGEFHQNFAYGFVSVPRYVSTKMIPVCWLIWLPDGHLKNHDFPFT